MAKVASTTSQDLLTAAETTISRGQEYLRSTQYPEGYWWGELESNPTMEAEYLLLTHFLGVADESRWRKLSNYMLSRQREDGSWGQYFEAPGDVSTSVECYFALKLAGTSADTHEMRKAREFILSKGGVPKVRIFTKIWLAMFGQWEWKGTPAMPPELIFLPSWFPFNIYEFSSWARATIVPMFIILSEQPTRSIPAWASIDELYPVPRDRTNYSLPEPGQMFGWRRFFFVADKLLRMYGKVPFNPLRKTAIRKAVKWIIAHQEADGSWGGIQPPWVYSLIALNHLGYPMDHPIMKKGFEGFEGFAIEEGDTWRVQGVPISCMGHVSSGHRAAGLGDGPR